MHDDIFVSAFGMRDGALDVTSAHAKLVKLRAAVLVERKERAAFKPAVAGTQDFRGVRRKEHDIAGSLVAEQVCKAHIKATRHLPQERDGRRTLARLDLTEHGAAHAREGGQALQTQAATPS